MLIRLLAATASSTGLVFAWKYSGSFALPTVCIFIACYWSWFALVGFAWRRSQPRSEGKAGRYVA